MPSYKSQDYSKEKKIKNFGFYTLSQSFQHLMIIIFFVVNLIIENSRGDAYNVIIFCTFCLILYEIILSFWALHIILQYGLNLSINENIFLSSNNLSLKQSYIINKLKQSYFCIPVFINCEYIQDDLRVNFEEYLNIIKELTSLKTNYLQFTCQNSANDSQINFAKRYDLLELSIVNKSSNQQSYILQVINQYIEWVQSNKLDQKTRSTQTLKIYHTNKVMNFQIQKLMIHTLQYLNFFNDYDYIGQNRFIWNNYKLNIMKISKLSQMLKETIPILPQVIIYDLYEWC
ncbi:hypothetical protein ABPG72_016428 [Tetrahymena utriculariae]